MPRVNRDLQRRLAARRERERRRPASERRYRFQSAAPADADLDAIEADEEELTDGASQSAVAERPTASRAGGRRDARLAQTPRAAPRPFADYRVEYAYVANDLRRLGLVVAAILVVLILLFFVLPR
jgi:hypothetical protein